MEPPRAPVAQVQSLRRGAKLGRSELRQLIVVDDRAAPRRAALDNVARRRLGEFLPVDAVRQVHGRCEGVPDELRRGGRCGGQDGDEDEVWKC